MRIIFDRDKEEVFFKMIFKWRYENRSQPCEYMGDSISKNNVETTLWEELKFVNWAEIFSKTNY